MLHFVEATVVEASKGSLDPRAGRSKIGNGRLLEAAQHRLTVSGRNTLIFLRPDALDQPACGANSGYTW